MIGIVDYNAGNITSVEHALESLGVEFICSKNPRDLENCDKLIFPGDGDAAYAMQQLGQTGFREFLKKSVASNIPLLGICVGAQIIFEHSEEGDVDCLGFLKGTIRHFSNVWKDTEIDLQAVEKNNESRKIPHMGWNDVAYANGSSPLFDGIPEHSDFYFIHSYVIQPADWSVVKGYAEYGVKVPACVSQGNITAFQFHPEKSGKWGMKILENFCKGDCSKNDVTNKNFGGKSC